jgi:alkanesulfonate monooxygenase SsuD/methylene tetrahydromethanopterin reductase-like flavin-dependent oxidoreductase (luciferase family)
VNYRGPRAVIDNAYVLPKPASKIPVILGGGTSAMTTDKPTSSRAVKRIATRADGWLPLLPAPGPAGANALRAEWDHIRNLAAEHGRDPSKMEMIVAGNVTFTERPQDHDRAAFTAPSTRSWTTSGPPPNRAPTR